MSDKKISQLTASTTPLAGTEVLPIVQSGATVQVSVSNLTAGRAVSASGLTTTGGAVIQGLTVGLGANAVAGNTAVGVVALASGSLSGGNNTAVGSSALTSLTTGVFNTAVGQAALNAGTGGNYNAAVGASALVLNTSGQQNTALGAYSLSVNITGSFNTAVGVNALSNSTGSQNLALGQGAGSSLTTGSNNTFIGSYAGTAGLSDTVVISAGTAERMRIDSSGNLSNNGYIRAQVAGEAALHTYNNQADNVLVNAPIGTVDFIASTGGKYSSVKGIVTSAYSDQVGLAFYTNSGSTYSEKMRIDTSGNVGIGVTPSAWGSGWKGLQNGAASFAAASGYAAIGNNWFTSATADTYISSNFATRYYQNAGQHIWNTAASGTAGNPITFTQVMGIGTTGDITANTGNIIQGTAAKGINFTANTPAAGKTSQLLNWYEEGTWTPADGSGAGLSLTVTCATYTRVGRIVTAQGFVTYPATVSALAAKISGFPFAPITTTGYYSIAPVNTTASIVAVIRAWAGAGATCAFVTANGNVDVTNAQLTGALVIFSISYFV